VVSWSTWAGESSVARRWQNALLWREKMGKDGWEVVLIFLKSAQKTYLLVSIFPSLMHFTNAVYSRISHIIFTICDWNPFLSRS
jgi:hypothetical protein